MNNFNGNIILIGFMGCGKTSLGRWISQNIGFSFYDTDEYIVSKEKREIKEIFAVDGEEYFRDLETATIADMCSNITNAVVSVGGGLPLRLENRALLKKLGTVVYLRTTESTLATRLSNDKKRPLLAGTDIKKKIHELMLQRESIYLDAADIIVNTDNLSFEQIFHSIKDKLIK